MRVPRSAARVLAKWACFAGVVARFPRLALRLALRCAAVSGNRSRTAIAVESRAMCPIKRSRCVAAITASCNSCGNCVRANSAKARENLDSCGMLPTLAHPQNRRSASSTASREIRSRVVGKFKIAFATNAVASAARSFAGLPVEHRRRFNTTPIGANNITAASNSNWPLKGPTARATRGNSSSCKTCVNSVTICRAVIFIGVDLAILFCLATIE